MDYLSNLRLFMRIQDLGSISAAARDMRISAAVASSRLAQLEQHLGARLFNRSTRSLKATEHGLALYDGAKRIIGTVDEVEADVARLSGGPRGTIFVGSQFAIGRHLLASLIPQFRQQYPDIHVRLRMSDRKFEIVDEGLDMGFVVDKLFDSDLRIRSIARCPRLFCASPAFIDTHGAPDTIDDIIANKMPCLQLRFPGAHEFKWNVVTATGTRAYSVHAPLESDDGDILTQWALSGCGIVNKPVFEVAPHLAAGSLVEIARQTPPEPVQMAILLPDRRLQDPKVKLFGDYMVAACRKKLETITGQLPR